MYDTQERKCYRIESPFFHKVNAKGCEKHEEQPSFRMSRKYAIGYCKTK